MCVCVCICDGGGDKGEFLLMVTHTKGDFFIYANYYFSFLSAHFDLPYGSSHVFHRDRRPSKTKDGLINNNDERAARLSKRLPRAGGETGTGK